jgi:hypothetical protein
VEIIQSQLPDDWKIGISLQNPKYIIEKKIIVFTVVFVAVFTRSRGALELLILNRDPFGRKDGRITRLLYGKK